ncbi:hypothetical protein [Natrinema salaciae]|uniref:hypothetical protein n=1 Tax=Natrinema salaciae TaxID=1186196 RepID=UPI001FDFB9F0|nr:hypothetical protein [Natrinema salaciae]
MSLGGVTLPLAGCTNDAAEDGTEGDDGEEGSDGGGGEEGSDGTGNETDDEETPTAGPSQQEFSGNGETLTDDFDIGGGLTIVDATHDGDGDFEVRLMPQDDGNGTLFADWTGSYDGRTAWHMTGGTYRLSVVAGGDWEVFVRQPRDESGESPPFSFSGSGNDVHGPFEFDGTYRPSGDYDGDRFIVHFLSSTGDTREFLFHDGSIGNPSSFEFHDAGYIEVKSDGEWSVEIG